MQIRYNLSHLEQWARDQNLVTSMDSDVTDMLLPIIQAAQLLQARKSEDDVESICAMCNRMSSNQVGYPESTINFDPSEKQWN